MNLRGARQWQPTCTTVVHIRAISVHRFIAFERNSISCPESLRNGPVRVGHRPTTCSRGYWNIRTFNIFTIVCLAIAMPVMLATSLPMSRDFFAFMTLDRAFAVRESHMFAGYWTFFIMAIHLGTRWMVVRNTIRSTLCFSSLNPAPHGPSGGDHGYCDLGCEKFFRDCVRFEADADLLPRNVGLQRKHGRFLYQQGIDRRALRST